MKTIHTPSSGWRTLAPALILVLLNLLPCIAFLALRPANIPFIEERERARQTPGDVFGTSGDALMFIAGRPLRQWDRWHGGEVLWIKITEIINLPSLRSTKYFGDAWSSYAAAHGLGSFTGDTWIRAYIYLFISSVQWFLLGVVISTLIRRRAGMAALSPNTLT